MTLTASLGPVLRPRRREAGSNCCVAVAIVHSVGGFFGTLQNPQNRFERRSQTLGVGLDGMSLPAYYPRNFANFGKVEIESHSNMRSQTRFQQFQPVRARFQAPHVAYSLDLAARRLAFGQAVPDEAIHRHGVAMMFQEGLGQLGVCSD